MSHRCDNSIWSEFFSTAESPVLGPETRPGVLGRQTLNARLDSALRDASLDETRAELLRSLALLWHDHLDAAHTIVQRIENEDGAFIHGIMHRREPDYWNAKYWFRNAGRHRISPALAERAASLLAAANEPGLRDKMVPGGEWDPFAFVDACQQAEKLAHAAPVRQTLRAIQAAEFALLVDYLVSPPRS